MVRLSVSITPELENYLKNNPDLSPSKMLQAQILQVRTNRDMVFNEVAELQKKNTFLRNRLQEATNFIEKKGLIDEFVGVKK